MVRLRVKNWSEFQHYKDRSPAWIKLHKKTLDDYEFHCLPLASRALAPMIWLLASESSDGVLDYDKRKIAFRLHTSEKEIEDAIKPLIDSGFLIMVQGASAALAEPERPASLEKRREEKEYMNDRFQEFWAAYPHRGKHQDPRKPAQDKWERKVRGGADPSEIIAGAKAYADTVRSERIEPQHVAQAVTWLNQERWEDCKEPELTPEEIAALRSVRGEDDLELPAFLDRRAMA